jgi:hypothetical protein
VGRKPTFMCLGLGSLKAFGVVDSVDDCHKHGLPSFHLGANRTEALPIANAPARAYITVLCITG